MGKKKKNKKADAAAQPKIRMLSENRKARHQFDILETLECGLMLTGSEVKSLRDGKVSLNEAYGRVRGGEVWLMGCDIPEYAQATLWNHAPKRPRKLLMHKKQVEKFANKAKEKGLTLMPLRIYFNDRGIAKVEMGLGRGKKLHDKRESTKKADVQRDLARAKRMRNRGE